ncbi:MAG: hypothetical protein NT031_19445 [Planctomycetota bacterium]|nr:hypothetical protein [Planctomycetota bacterium]
MPPTERSRAGFMIAMVSLMFLIAVGVTIAAAFLFVEHDRGFLFWVTTGLLVFIELVAYSFVLSLLVGRAGGVKVSTPMIVASWRILALYALVALTSVVIYSLLRDKDHPSDKIFATVLMIETALGLLGVMLVRSWDIYFQANEQPMLAHREAHRTMARPLGPVLERLRAIRLADPPMAVRLGRLMKRLETVEQALSHSHGGGVGSREAGVTHPGAPDAQELIAQGIADLDAVATGLEAGTNSDAFLAEGEKLATRLQGGVSALELD